MMLSCKRTATRQARANSSQLTSFASLSKKRGRTKCPKLQPLCSCKIASFYSGILTQLIVSYESRLYHHPIMDAPRYGCHRLHPLELIEINSFSRCTFLLVNRLRSEITLVFTLGLFLSSRSYSVHITV